MTIRSMGRTSRHKQSHKQKAEYSQMEVWRWIEGGWCILDGNCLASLETLAMWHYALMIFIAVQHKPPLMHAKNFILKDRGTLGRLSNLRREYNYIVQMQTAHWRKYRVRERCWVMWPETNPVCQRKSNNHQGHLYLIGVQDCTHRITPSKRIQHSNPATVTCVYWNWILILMAGHLPLSWEVKYQKGYETAVFCMGLDLEKSQEVIPSSFRYKVML